MHLAEPPRAARLARRALDSLTALVFLLVMAAPTVDHCVRPDSERSPELRERRKPAPEPDLPSSLETYVAYPASYEAFYKDDLGLRDQLLRWNSIVKVFVFNVSPAPIAYIGKDGWMFYTGANTRENHRGLLGFPQKNLEEWARMLRDKRAMLAARGIEYLYVIAPDKETIYADKLPDFMRQLGPTRREQLVAFLRTHAPEVGLLDLTDALLASRRDEAEGDPAYGMLGTHWSGRGALVAVRALLERLQVVNGGFSTEGLRDFERKEIDDPDDSWSTTMYIGDLLVQSSFSMRPKQSLAKVELEGGRRLGRVRKSVIEGSTRPRVLMMHDSFGPYIEDGLAEECSYLECRWGRTIDMGDVELIDPDVFIDLYVERSFNTTGPEDLLPTDRATWSGRFFRSSRVLAGIDSMRPDWGLTSLGDAEVGPAANAPKPRLPITQKLSPDRVVLPDLVPVEGEVPVLHLTIDSPILTELVLFYPAPETHEYARQWSYRKVLSPGTNELFVPLDQPGTQGQLRLKPGAHPQTYLLREFEIRSVPAR